MTTSRPLPFPTSGDLQTVLEIYADAPMCHGDVTFLLQSRVGFEVEGLADNWDPLLRRNTGKILREVGGEVMIGIAREGGRLLPRDYQLWRDLHQDLRHSDVQLLPVRALPAA